MSDKEWAKFFELVEKIVELPQPVNEKTKLVVDKSKEFGERADMNFEEFAAWDFSLYYD